MIECGFFIDPDGGTADPDDVRWNGIVLGTDISATAETEEEMKEMLAGACGRARGKPVSVDDLTFTEVDPW